MMSGRKNRRNDQRGNVFTVLLGAVAMAAVLSYSTYQIMSGPLGSAVRVSKKIITESEMQSVSKSIIVAAVNQSSSGDCDSDGSVEPTPWRTTAANKPTNGGLLPNTIGLKLTDPWGSAYGYCVWDVGTQRKAAGCGGAGANRLSGSPTPTAGNTTTQTVLAVISSGPDRRFQTTCNAYTNGTTDVITTSGDDIVRRYTYVDAAQATESLWTLEAATPTMATIDKDLEVGDSATVGSISALALSVSDKVNAGGGLQPGDDTDITVCNVGNKWLLRYNTTNDHLEYCDGAGTWKNATGADSIDLLDDGATNYATLYNVFLGDDAGAATTTGTHNTAVGISALAGNTIGNDNVALGQQALAVSTTGDRNTAIGYQTLMANTTGDDNTAIGYQSLPVNTTGAGNTGLGCQTLLANTTGTLNTAVGRLALSGVTTNGANTAIGYNAMPGSVGDGNVAVGISVFERPIGSYNVGVGNRIAQISANVFSQNVLLGFSTFSEGRSSNSVAIGTEALARGVSDGNVAVGYQALYNMTTANNNAFGHYALNLTTDGTGNEAFGYMSMKELTDIDSNTAFGYLSMVSNSASGGNNTTIGSSSYATINGSNNTAIGFYAMGASESGAANNVALGVAALVYNHGTGNIAAGVHALIGASSNDASYNVVLGTEALSTRAQAGVSVDSNVVIGSYAMQNGDGVQNVVIGYQTLRNAQTSGDNVAIGDGILVDATSSTAVTAIGHHVLAAAATSQRNTAVGTSAMAASLADENTAIGAAAMASNTTGKRNIAVGYQALVNTDDEEDNTAVGYQAMGGASPAVGVSSADGNVAVGNWALNHSVEGGYNVAVGESALQSLTNGVQSVAIGYQAALNFSSGSNAVAIGSGAMYSLEGEEGPTAIGYQANYSKTSGGGPDTVAGYMALFSNVDGGLNTAIGYEALAQCTNCLGNTVMGERSLSSAGKDSDRNTAVGRSTLYSISSRGGKNVAIGDGAGAYVGDNSEVNVFIGFTSGPTSLRSFSNGIAIGANAEVSQNNYARIGSDTITEIGGAVAWTATSDRRVKKDIVESDLGLDFINRLRPVSYRRINGNGRLDYGFIAQEVERALDGRVTNMVTQDNDARKTYQLRSADLLAPVVKSLQTIDQRQQGRRDRVAALTPHLMAISADIKQGLLHIFVLFSALLGLGLGQRFLRRGRA